MAHVVTAPLVIAKKENGSDLYLYRNAVVPDHVPDEQIRRLAALGLIEDVPDGARKTKRPTSESN